MNFFFRNHIEGMNQPRIGLFFIGLCLLILGVWNCDTPAAAKGTPFVTNSISPMEQSLIDEYEYVINEQFRVENAPTGMAVAIVKDGEVLLQKGYGLKSNNEKDSVDEHTVFRIASLSKGFASVLAALLVEEKKLEWSSKVKNYITDFQLSDSLATENLNLKHVLSQATGLPRHTFGNLIEAGQSLDQMIPRLREVAMIAQPGRVMAYQNLAYSLCQPMMESKSGISYDSLLKVRIFEPLKMENSSADFQSLMTQTNVAQPHRSRNSFPIKQENDYFAVLPAAGVNASISDMAIWINALLGHYPDVLSPRTLRPIFQQNHKLPKNNPWSRNWDGVESVGYAMGWRTINYKGQNLIYHGGYLNGYRTEMAFSFEEDVGIVVLSNSFSRFIIQSVPTFFDLYNEKFNPRDSMGISLDLEPDSFSLKK